jgi:hypothetical protein
MGSLKTTVTMVVTGTPVALSAGVTDNTVGGVTSAAAVVTKEPTETAARVRPALFVTLRVTREK